VGICITAIIQSSAATLAIAISMAQHLTLPGNAGAGISHLLPIVLGANIGTCATAFLAILQAETEGVRVATAHLLFKIAGAALALPFIWVLQDVTLLSTWPVAMQIASLHTAFNLFIAAIFLSMIPACDRIIQRLVRPHEEAKLRHQTVYLHDKVIPFPVLALSQAEAEISRTAGIVADMVEESLECIRRYDSSRRLHIMDRDDEVDFLHGAIIEFLTRIARQELGPDEARRSSMLIMVTTDLEHIGDIASKSLVNLANKIDQSPVPLSDEGRQELLDFFASTVSLLRKTLSAFYQHDRELAKKLLDGKLDMKKRFSSFVDCHMNRLYKRKKESLQTTSLHIDLLEEISRINHFAYRIADHIIKI
jgi:phosphate:Na+ symporter